MNELIEEIVKIVLTESNEFIREYDLKRIIENYVEREIDRRVDAYIEAEKDEVWANGYTVGKREAIESMKNHFEEMLYNI